MTTTTPAPAPVPHVLTSMQLIEEKFATGEWTHDSQEHIRLQLLAESSKRTDAFLFEEFFQQIARRTCTGGQGSVSFGWIGTFESDCLKFWFRLELENDIWNDCDEAFAAALSKQSLRIFRVRCVRSGQFKFYEREHGGKFGEEIAQAAFPAFIRRENKRSRVKDSTGQDGVRQGRATMVLEWLTDSTLTALSVRRRFMNTILPALGLWPIISIHCS